MAEAEAEAGDPPSTQSTQLNSPRLRPQPASPSPQPQPQPQPTSDALSSQPPRSPSSPSSSSSGGNTRRADIQPTWPRPRARALNIRRAPAVAIFSHPASAEYRLPDLGLDISWRPEDNAALFRLSAHIWLVHARGDEPDDTRVPAASSSRIFILIPPENVVRLDIDLSPAEEPFGPSTAAFRLTLSTPPGLVVPKTSTGTYTHRIRGTGYRVNENEIENKNKNDNENSASAERHRLLRLLAGSRTITVLAKVDQNSLPAIQANLLCAALAGGGVVADSHLADTTSLYWGQGGEVVDGVTLEAGPCPAPAYPRGSDDDAQLPAYSGPGPSVSRARGQKRPRVASSTSSTDSGSEPVSQERHTKHAASPATVEARFEARLAGLEAHLLAALESSQSALRSDILAHLETTKRDIMARLDDVENAAVDEATTRVAEMEEGILARLDNANATRKSEVFGSDALDTFAA